MRLDKVNELIMNVNRYVKNKVFRRVTVAKFRFISYNLTLVLTHGNDS